MSISFRESDIIKDLRVADGTLFKVKVSSIKGLSVFFVSGNRSGIQVAHVGRIRDRLAFLNVPKTIEDMDKLGYRLHKLMGD